MIAWLCAIVLALGAPRDDGLDAATTAHRDGRFADALAGFAAALDREPAARGAVLFAMGNCAFRLERFADAAWHYRRALARLPGEPRIAHNLALADAALGVRRDEPSTLTARVAEWLAALPGGVWLSIAAGLQGAALLALAIRGRAAFRDGWVAIALVAGVGVAVHTARRVLATPVVEGVVLAGEVELRGEPHRDERVTLRLRAGDVVQVVEASDRWMRVAHPRGGGWTRVGGVGIVD